VLNKLLRRQSTVGELGTGKGWGGAGKHDMKVKVSDFLRSNTKNFMRGKHKKLAGISKEIIFNPNES
jgi:hypothetical protein